MDTIKGAVNSITADMSDNLLITFIVSKEHRESAYAIMQSYSGQSLRLDIAIDKPIRSLNANAYFHVLVTKIAEKMKLGDMEVKHNLVIEYGTVMKDEDGQVVGIKLPSSVKVENVYKYAKWFDRREENGKYFDCYIIYKQTHTLDSGEMARLVDGVVKEAEELGIETLDQIKLKALTDKWEAREE